MTRVLVVDDHAIVRRGLRQILADEKDMPQPQEAASTAEALRILAGGGVDVAVVDVGLPDRNGIELLKEIRARWPKLPVLVLSVHPEDQLAERALRAGAAGYISKESAPSELVKAVRRVVSGHRYLSRTFAERVAGSLAQPASGPPHRRLSDREFSVFLRIAQGRRLKQIAAELGLSIKTISTHRAHILDKLELGSNAELALYAASQGLIPQLPRSAS